jgi:hypothetical protein
MIRFAAIAAAAASFGSTAQAATTATGTATAEILTTLTVTADADLRFGQIAANTGGTVVVGANGNVSSTGTLVSTGVRGPAAFTVTGTKDTAVTLTLPATTSDLTYQGSWNVAVQGPLPKMTLSAFTSQWNGGNTLDAVTGKADFNVGGTLAVATNQTPGLYKGTFSVSVEYQ